MELAECIPATTRALIKTAEYYMPVKLSTYSNFSVTVARVYYKAITNRNLFALLNMVAFVLKERSNGKVAVAVEAFDGEHRGRLQGGGQYYAHQDVEANELVRPFMPGSDKPSALTKVGKALRVEALAAHVIKLLLNVSPTTPRIPGIFVPPLAPCGSGGGSCGGGCCGGSCCCCCCDGGGGGGGTGTGGGSLSGTARRVGFAPWFLQL